MNPIVAAYDPTFAKEIYQWVVEHSDKFEDLILTQNDFDQIDDYELGEILTTIIQAEYSGEYDYEYDDDIQPSSNGTQCDYIYQRGPDMHGNCIAAIEEGSTKCKYHNSIIFSNKLFEPIKINELVDKVANYEKRLVEQEQEISQLKAKIEDLKYRPKTGTSYNKAKERFENTQK